MRAPSRAGALASVVPLLLVSAASAQAQEAPATPAAPPELALKLTIEKAPGNEAFKGSTWRALTVTDRYVPGTKVTFEFTAGKRRTVKRVTLQPVKGSTKGAARVHYRSASASRVVVRSRIGDGQPAAPTGRVTRIVQQFTPSVSAGASGPAVRWLQRRLKAKGYVIGAAGRYDARTSRAVLAFRKVTGMGLTTQANRAVFEALRAGKGSFKVRFPSHGRHIEGDIRRQVLALIGEGGKVERIYHTSPGAPATPTIRGTFRVYRKDPGTNEKGMYASSYFIRGYAIHGYPSVPTYRASHGCFRVPMDDARSIYDWIRMGTIVDTYV